MRPAGNEKSARGGDNARAHGRTSAGRHDVGDRSENGTGRKHSDRTPRAVRVAMREASSIHRALVREGATLAEADDLLQVAVMAAWWSFCVKGDAALPEDDAGAGKAMRTFLAVVAFRAAPSCEDAVVARATLRRLEAATTPERWRVLVGDADGAEGPEIAAEERIPVNTVYCRLRLAREDVALALARDRVRAGRRG